MIDMLAGVPRVNELSRTFTLHEIVNNLSGVKHYFMRHPCVDHDRQFISGLQCQY